MPILIDDVPLVRTNQVRILVVLAGEDCPPMTKAVIAEAAGFSEGAGTINLSINGRREGKGGKTQPGLIELGLVQRFPLDIDGKEEVVYIITELGRKALELWMDTNPRGLPKLRDKDASTNRRYQ